MWVLLKLLLFLINRINLSICLLLRLLGISRGTKELCDGLEPTVAAVTLTSNERTTSFTLAEQSTATASTSIPR